jgi:putative membrane protein
VNQEPETPKDAKHEPGPRAEGGASSARDGVKLALLGVRSLFGGVLMGLANLVPGISGGTMLLAAGIYPRFVEALAEVTRFRFRWMSIYIIGLVAVAAVGAVLLLAGPVKTLVVEQRWIMYSLFIGLTLGGVPLVWRMVRPATGATWIGVAAGLAAMVVLVWMQQTGLWASGGAEAESLLLMVLAGVAGASAMILPGVSGGYLLLVLGVYVTILGAVDEIKQALVGTDPAALVEPGLRAVLPVGLGVVLGVVVVSNLLQWLLRRHEKGTLGVLIGLLLGAVVGLWPFQVGVKPEPGEIVRGREMTEQRIEQLDPERYPVRFFRPSVGQVFGSLGLIVSGFAVTSLIGRLGQSREEEEERSESTG